MRCSNSTLGNVAHADHLPESPRFVDRFVYAFRRYGPSTEDPTVGRRASTVRHLLHELSVFMNWDSGTTFVGRETLAERMGVNVETVTLAAQAAQAAGWLTVQRRPKKGGRGEAGVRNLYRCVIPPEVIEQMKVDGLSDDLGDHTGEATPEVIHEGQRNNRQPMDEGRRINPEGRRINPPRSSDKAVEVVGSSDGNLSVNPLKNPSVNSACARSERPGGAPALHADIEPPIPQTAPDLDATLEALPPGPQTELRGIWKDYGLESYTAHWHELVANGSITIEQTTDATRRLKESEATQ